MPTSVAVNLSGMSKVSNIIIKSMLIRGDFDTDNNEHCAPRWKRDTFEHIIAWTNLTAIDLSCNLYVYNDMISLLVSTCTKIEACDVSGCVNLTDVAFIALTNLKLKKLKCENCHISDKSLFALAKCLTLERIDLKKSFLFDITISDAGVIALLSCLSLRVIKIEWYNISDKATERIFKLQFLSAVSFSGCVDLTDITIENLLQCNNLQFVDIRCCTKITPAAIIQLSFKPTIKCIDIYESDAEEMKLSKCKYIWRNSTVDLF